MFTIMIEHKIDAQKIADAVTAAVEAPNVYGCGYWMQVLNPERDPKAPKGKEGPWYSFGEYFDSPFRMIAKFDRENLEEGNGKGRKIITRHALQLGLIKLAKGHPDIFAKLFVGDEDSDAGDAEIMLQYVVFGKVIYG